MADLQNLNLDYERPIKIAESIYWVGFYDLEAGLQCNPYLVVDNGEAVLLDSGSRPDFPTVMMKILQTGIAPSSIKALVYHHFDPDVCGSIPNFEDIIGRKDLMIIADKHSHMFIRHYGISSRLNILQELGHVFTFSSGRKLKFYNTPYAHCNSSFMTYDEKTGVLFSSDLLGSYSKKWSLFLDLEDKGIDYNDLTAYISDDPECPLKEILDYHKQIFPSESILQNAIRIIKGIDCSLIAPQHGSIISGKNDISFVLNLLGSLRGVGIDCIVEKNGGKG